MVLDWVRSEKSGLTFTAKLEDKWVYRRDANLTLLQKAEWGKEPVYLRINGKTDYPAKCWRPISPDNFFQNNMVPKRASDFQESAKFAKKRLTRALAPIKNKIAARDS